MILGKKKRNSVKLITNTTEIEESRKVILLGITIDNFLISNVHIDNLCGTANYKLHALRKIRKYLSLEKTKLLFTTKHLRWYITVPKTMINFFGIIVKFRSIKVTYVL